MHFAQMELNLNYHHLSVKQKFAVAAELKKNPNLIVVKTVFDKAAVCWMSRLNH